MDIESMLDDRDTDIGSKKQKIEITVEMDSNCEELVVASVQPYQQP